MNDLMLDIETLSTAPDAMLFEVALVPFSLTADHVNEEWARFWQIKPTTGVMDPETVGWWLQQERTPNWSDHMHEKEAARQIHVYLKHNAKGARLWAKPTSFDCIILQSFLHRWGYELPVDFRLWRDMRTVMDLAGFPPEPTSDDDNPHNALWDAHHQVEHLQLAWKVLKP